MNQRKLFICTAGILLGSIFTSCESKFSESSPTVVKLKGLSLEERISQKEKVDMRIEEVQKSANKTKKIFDMYRKVQNPTSSKTAYTPFDFILDVNVELKTQIPEQIHDKLVWKGRVEIPFKGVSEDCRAIETQLETGVLFDETVEPKSIIGEKLVYSIKTCKSHGEFLEAIVVQWIGSNVEFQLVNKNLEAAFNDLVSTDSVKNSTCSIVKDSKEIIESISCENFEVGISSTSKAHIKSLNFRNLDNIRLEAVADIFENGIAKATSHLQVLSNGDVKVDLKKIEPESK